MITIDEKRLLLQLKELKTIGNFELRFGSDSLEFYAQLSALDGRVGSILDDGWKLKEVIPVGTNSNKLSAIWVKRYADLTPEKLLKEAIPKKKGGVWLRTVPIEVCPIDNRRGRIAIRTTEHGKRAIVKHKEGDGRVTEHDITELLHKIGKSVADVELLIERQETTGKRVTVEQHKSNGSGIGVIENSEIDDGNEQALIPEREKEDTT